MGFDNEILNKTKNKKNFPDYFLIEDEKIYDESVISNKFNKYFANIGPNLSAKIKTDSQRTVSYYLQKKLKLHSLLTW